MTVRRAADKGEKDEVVTEMVDAPNVEVTKEEQKVMGDERAAEVQENRERAQVVVEATKDTVTDPVVESAEVPVPKSAGTVDVTVLHDAFNFIDHTGTYQTVPKGGTAKVSSAQAKRGEELGAVERA